jgi:phage N-6-adenine-methyltransferase
MNLAVDRIRTDGGTQPRASINDVMVAEYAADMDAGAAFPPVVVFFDGSDYWLADGFHRLHAAMQLGRVEVVADVRQGTQTDAQWFSYGVNQSHGLRRTNEDKRRAVEAALRHPVSAGLSNVQVAKHCGVSEITIRRYREPIFDNVEDTRTVTRNGTTYPMQTANIGRVVPNEEPPVYEIDDPPFDAPALAVLPVGSQWPAYPPMPTIAPQMPSYDGNEWYTPIEWIEAARSLYGAIDLDPASCAEAQAVVQASRYFTKADNGLLQPWHGRVWLNPPYSFPEVQQFTEKAVAEFDVGNAIEVLILVNNCTDAGWFIRLAECFPVVFSRGRASFWRPNQESFATRQGQALFFLGSADRVDAFRLAFMEIAYAPNA